MYMDEKRAYCCLNCTASQNCCGPCDKCAACCRECGDTSSCATSAYFGKDDKIYRRYIATYKINYYNCFGPYGCLPPSSNETVETYMDRWIGKLDSKDGIKKVYGGSSYKLLWGICDPNFANQEFRYDEDSKYFYYGTFGKFIGESECNGEKSESSGEIGYGSLPIDFPIVEAKDGECNLPNYNDPFDSVVVSGEIDFVEELKTYNNEGEIVADPIPEDPYDPCNPIRTATAPGCHFFDQ